MYNHFRALLNIRNTFQQPLHQCISRKKPVLTCDVHETHPLLAKAAPTNCNICMSIQLN